MTDSISCESGNGFDGRLGVRVSSIFVIGFGSMLGALLPIILARSEKMPVHPLAFFVTKYFGSGVIISTAFMHLVAPAHEALKNPCLTGPITDYDWVEGIVLMSLFLMLLIELMASRYDVFGENAEEVEASISSEGLFRTIDKPGSFEPSQMASGPVSIVIANESRPNSGSGDSGTESFTTLPRSSIPGREGDFSYPPGGEDHMGHRREHDLNNDHHLAAQMTSIFILEFGVIFHSVFIGLTLAVTGSNFNILYIVLAFHQTFEGLGLGTRLADMKWPDDKQWMPWVLGGAFGVTTPIAIAIGLAVSSSFDPGSQTGLIVNGIFDSIGAGILIYVGTIELMGHELMFSPEMRKASMNMLLLAYFCMCLGAGLMAVLAKWA